MACINLTHLGDNVIAFPTALTEPVKQRRLRGRYPKSVASIREANLDRYRVRWAQEKAELQIATLEAWAAHYATEADVLFERDVSDAPKAAQYVCMSRALFERAEQLRLAQPNISTALDLE